MYHFVYETTNNINGMIYIGAHTTNKIEDGYLGGGKYLINAIKKYGKENFSRKILEFFTTQEEAYIKESQLVTMDFVKRTDTYNIKCGGKGGLYGIKRSKESIEKTRQGHLGKKLSDVTKEKIRKSNLGQKRSIEIRKNTSINHADFSGANNPFFGKTHSEETKKAFKEAWKKQRNKDICNAYWQNKKRDENTKKKISEKNLGRKHMHHPELKKYCAVPINEIEDWIKNGWILGRKIFKKDENV